MRGHRPLPRLATALAAAGLLGLPALGAAPASASESVVVDVLKLVDGAYVVETVSVPASTAEATADRLEAAPEVVVASPSVTYEVDAGSDPYWRTVDPQATSAVKEVWPRTRGEGQTVAVLDTGFDTAHPDLAGAFVPGTDTAGGPGDDWHGTGVAGIVAARAENGIGSAGMAPEAKVMPIRVCNDTGCPSAAIAKGILWAVDHGADVINMSLSGPGYSDVSAAAVRYALDKDIPVVASSGNDGLNGNPVMYPAAHSGVIAVSSTKPDGTPSDWAVNGWQVDVSTVGDSVLLTLPGNQYGNGSGTSFSGPAVAGAAALLRGAVPGITPEQVQAALQAGSDSGNSWPRTYGAGRLHVPSAVAAADRTDASVTVTPAAGQVSVSWPAVDGATAYAVRVDGVLRTTLAETTTVVTGLTDGNQVAVDVQPDNAERSRPVLATVGAGAPDTPTVTAAALRGTATSAVLDLTASVTGVPAYRFTVLRNGVSIGSYNLGLSATPKVVALGIGAMPTTETRWQIRGYDQLGRTSGTSAAVTTAGDRPAPPPGVTGLTAQLSGDDVLLTWNDLGTAYTYRVSVGDDVVAAPRTAGAVVPAPAPGATRTYAVTAVDAWDRSGPAVPVDVTRIPKPGMTVGPSVVGSLVVGQTVSTPDAFTGADTVTHAWRACTESNCVPLAGDVTHVITSAEAGKRLEVEATATNAGGVVSAVSARSGYVAAAAPATFPGAPAIGTATAGDGSATVRWAEPVSNGGAPITGYSVRAYRAGGWVGTSTVGAGTTNTVVTGLMNGAPHTFTVTAVNSVGPGAESAQSAPVTPRVPALAPGVPVLGTPVPGNTTVRLTWSPPADDGGAPVLRYSVGVYRGTTQLSYRETTATELLLTGLANGVGHTFSVTATNSAGSGLAASTTATPRTVPGSPRPRLSTALPGAAMVRWAPPSGNGGSPVTGYRVQVYRGTSLIRTLTVASDVSSALVTGLQNRSTHVAVLTAINAAGAGPSSSTAGIVPKALRRPGVRP